MDNNLNKIRILTALLILSLIGNGVLGYLFSDSLEYKQQYKDATYTINLLQSECEENYDNGYSDGYSDGYADAQSGSDSNYSNEDFIGTTVYITDTGSKYHRYGCQYLRQSCHSISLSDAEAQGYEACSVCF